MPIQKSPQNQYKTYAALAASYVTGTRHSLLTSDACIREGHYIDNVVRTMTREFRFEKMRASLGSERLGEASGMIRAAWSRREWPVDREIAR